MNKYSGGGRLDGWFERQRARNKKFVSLDEALLGGAFLRYAIHRMKVFLVRVALTFGRRLVEFWLIVSFFQGFDVALILLARVFSVLGLAYWWGGLEKLRGDVRSLRREGRGYQIRETLRPWLNGTLTIAALLIAFLSAAFLVVWGATGAIDPAEVLVFVLGTQFIAGIFIRTYHSAAYAVRRIYRPVAAVLAVECLGAFLAIGGRPWFGVWALPVSTAVTAVVGVWISWHFISQAYWRLGWYPIRWGIGPQWATSLIRKLRANFHLPGVAYASAQSEWLVAFVLALPGGALGNAGYLLAPVLAAGREWVQLFYFDLKKLQSMEFAGMREFLENRMEWLALIVGVVCAVLSTLVLFAFGGSLESGTILGIAGFCISSSLLASLQIRAYSAELYAALLFSGVLVFGAAAVEWVIRPDFGISLVGIAIGTLGALYLVQRSMHRNFACENADREISLADWSHRLARKTEPVHVGMAMFTQQRGRFWRAKRLARWLNVRLAGRGLACAESGGKVFWFETASEDPREVLPAIMAASGGEVARITISRPVRGGSSAAWEVLSTEVPFSLVDCSGWPSLCLEEETRKLVEEFEEKFPSGRVLFPGKALPVPLGPTHARGVLGALARRANDRANRYAATFSFMDKPVVIFLRGGGSARRFRSWTRRLALRELATNLSLSEQTARVLPV